jgi:oligogalacturonide transport system substrate-binding protein
MAANFSWSTELNRIMGKRTNLVPVEMPILPNPVDTGIITRPAQLMMINNASPNRGEAVKFLTYFFYDLEAADVLGATRGVPASSIARQHLSRQGKIDPKVELITNFSLAKAGKPQAAWQTNSEITQIMDTVVERFWYGQLTPAQAARQLREELSAKLAVLR